MTDAGGTAERETPSVAATGVTGSEDGANDCTDRDAVGMPAKGESRDDGEGKEEGRGCAARGARAGATLVDGACGERENKCGLLPEGEGKCVGELDGASEEELRDANDRWGDRAAFFAVLVREGDGCFGAGDIPSSASAEQRPGSAGAAAAGFKERSGTAGGIGAK